MTDSASTRLGLPTLAARLSLGSNSPAQSTADHLRFQLDHALARDAVHTSLDVSLLADGLRARNLVPLPLRSAAPNRPAYLRRPDLGRTLHPDSRAALLNAVISTGAQRSGETPVSPSQAVGAPFMPQLHRGMSGMQMPNPTPSILYPSSPIPCLFLLADGLSALALERHALPLLDALPSSLSSLLSPLIPVVTNARVAIGDEIGELLGAEITVLLIGERPGLSSPDSLGVYITWQPRRGRMNAERNCISNIRAEGLSYDEAAHRIAHYLREAERLQTTGIALKDPELQPRI